MVRLDGTEGGIALSKVKVNKSELVSFIGGFGPGVNDLKMEAKNNQLVAGVALSTHFLQKAIVVEQIEGGEYIVSDIGKMLAFLKACGNGDVELQQNLNGKNPELRVKCGNSTITVPTTKEVQSVASLEAAGRLVQQAGESNWTEFAGTSLSGYAVVDVADMLSVVSLGKVVGSDQPYNFSFIPKQSKAVINCGKAHTGNIYHAFDLMDAKEDDGNVLGSQFGPWFTEVISTLPLGKAEIYTGDNAVLVFNHQEKDCLLVVIDQRPDEE